MVENGVSRFLRVTVVRDFGTTVEVNDGIKDGDQVIHNPPVDLADGRKVKVRPGPAGQAVVSWSRMVQLGNASLDALTSTGGAATLTIARVLKTSKGSPLGGCTTPTRIVLMSCGRDRGKTCVRV